MKNYSKDKQEFQGYILVYFDNRIPAKKYEAFLDEIRYHIYDRRKVPRKNLILIDGGVMEEMEVSFYILPKEWKPPAPDPTLPSPQFMKKK